MPVRSATNPISTSRAWNHKHPLNQGLLAWYMVIPQWFGGLKWYDLIDNGCPGTLTSMNNSSNGFSGPKQRRGAFGSMLFDGTAGYITLGTPAKLNLVGQTNPFTLSAWIKINGHPANNAQFLSKSSLGSTNQFSMIVVAATGRVQIIAGTAGGSTGTIDVTDNAWHHIVMTVPVATSGMLLYTDGTVETYTAGTGLVGTLTTTNDTLIGARRDASNADSLRWFPGSIDDVRIWNRVLSAAEVRQVYAEAILGYPGTLNRLRRTYPGTASVSTPSGNYAYNFAGKYVVKP